MIIFRPKFEDPDHDHPEFSLILSKKHNYDIVRPLTMFLNLTDTSKDVAKSWRVPATRSYQASLHNDARHERFSQVYPQALSEPKHSGNYGHQLHKPNDIRHPL